MPRATKKNERKTERKWQLLLVLDTHPHFFLGISLQSRRCPSCQPPMPAKCRTRHRHRPEWKARSPECGNLKMAWKLGIQRGVFFHYSGWGVQGQMTNFDEFMIHCILHPKMNVGSFNKPDFTIQKKKIGYVNPPILSEFRHEPAVWHRSDHCVFGCQPKSSNQLHLKNCNSCPPSKPSTRNSDGHPVSLNF